MVTEARETGSLIGSDKVETIPTLAAIAPALPKVSSRERRNIATTTPGTGTTPQGLAR